MSRIPLAYATPDIAALARSLREQLRTLGHLPGHVEMLNMLARAAGHRNFQQFRSEAEPGPVPGTEPAPAPPPPPEPDRERVAKVARHFDGEGRMLRWPAKTNQQELAVWVLWSRIPAGVVFTERQISDLISDLHLFGDHAILRRTLYEMGLVDRTQNGREYRRIEQAPPPELGPLLAAIAARAKS